MEIMLISCNKTESQKRCDRCDVKIENSTWKGIRVCLKSLTKQGRKFYCAKCVLKLKRFSTIKIQHLDEFVKDRQKN